MNLTSISLFLFHPVALPLSSGDYDTIDRRKACPPSLVKQITVITCTHHTHRLDHCEPVFTNELKTDHPALGKSIKWNDLLA